MLEALESGARTARSHCPTAGGTTTSSIRSSRSATTTTARSSRTAPSSPRGFPRARRSRTADPALRFFDSLTQSQIAQQVGISQMHVSRLIRRALEEDPPGDRGRRGRPEAPACSNSVSCTVKNVDVEPTVTQPVARGADALELDGTTYRRANWGQPGRGARGIFARPRRRPERRVDRRGRDELAARGHRVVAVDGPGFGASPALPPERYAVHELAGCSGGSRTSSACSGRCSWATRGRDGPVHAAAERPSDVAPSCCSTAATSTTRTCRARTWTRRSRSASSVARQIEPIAEFEALIDELAAEIARPVTPALTEALQAGTVRRTARWSRSSPRRHAPPPLQGAVAERRAGAGRCSPMLPCPVLLCSPPSRRRRARRTRRPPGSCVDGPARGGPMDARLGARPDRRRRPRARTRWALARRLPGAPPYN